LRDTGGRGASPGEGGRRGEATPAGDIDILVEFREGEETFDHFMDRSISKISWAGRPISSSSIS